MRRYNSVPPNPSYSQTLRSELALTGPSKETKVQILFAGGRHVWLQRWLPPCTLRDFLLWRGPLHFVALLRLWLPAFISCQTRPLGCSRPFSSAKNRNFCNLGRLVCLAVPSWGYCQWVGWFGSTLAPRPGESPHSENNSYPSDGESYWVPNPKWK